MDAEMSHREWVETRDPYYWTAMHDRMDLASVEHVDNVTPERRYRFQQIGNLNIYALGPMTYDFGPYMTHVQGGVVGRSIAFGYLSYRRFAKRHGFKPSEFDPWMQADDDGED